MPNGETNENKSVSVFDYTLETKTTHLTEEFKEAINYKKNNDHGISK